MNKPFALAILFFSHAASAKDDCTVTIFSNGEKKTESKIEMKPDKIGTAAEKDGYVFQLVRNESDPKQIEKLIVIEKASTRRSISSFASLKSDDPTATAMTALLEDVGGPTIAKGARIICKLKP